MSINSDRLGRSTAEKLAKLSESAGTPFTAEEYLNSVAESSEEMSTEQLRSVAGGVSEPTLENILGFIVSFGVRCAAKAITSLITEGSADKCHIGVMKSACRLMSPVDG